MSDTPKRLQDRILPVLAGDGLHSDHERSLRLVMLTAASFGALVHILLVVIFQATQIPVLAVINAVNLLVYAAVYLLVIGGKYPVAGALITLDVIVLVFVYIYYLGVDTYPVLYLFITLIMQISIPYTKLWIRQIFMVLLWLSMLATILMDLQHLPLLDMQEAQLPLTIFNIHAGISGCLVELSIGGISRRVIDHYSIIRMEELKNQAYTDSLTGLYNRRYADLLFESIAGGKAGRSWCVAMADIDDFKQVNDCHGHNTGDRVLVGVTSIMTRALRKTDVIFRWGGEEFLILLEDVDADTAVDILNKVRMEIADMEIPVDGGVIRVTVTIGVALLNIRDRMGSIVECDKKLYSGKLRGKNQVVG